MCFMVRCPYVPPHEFNLDFPHLMLRYRAADLYAECRRIGDRRRLGRMGDELITILVDVDQGAEGAVADLVLRAGVDERALAARKGRLFMLVLEQILAKTRPDFLEQPAQATDDRIVAANRMQRLAQGSEEQTSEL